ncbi:MAG: class II aldolase/adducin family protein [Candidatus Jordarchaeaceae archaeon]
MKIKDIKKDLIKVSHQCGNKGWCPGTSGNLSVFDRDSNEVYIKVSGKSMTDLKISDIITLTLEGKIKRGEGIPSKEIYFHLAIYNTRKDVNAVLHTHSPFAIAFAIANTEVPLVSVTAQECLKKVPLVEYAPPGSSELGNYVVEGFRDPKVKAILLKKHGVVTVGSDIHQAFHINEWLEDAAKVAFLSSIIKTLKMKGNCLE